MAKAPPVAVYIGGDAFERRECVQKIGKRCFGDDPYDVLRFDAAARETPRVIEELMSFSMLAENQVIVLDQLEKIPKKKNDEPVEEDDDSTKTHLERLVDYLKHPRSETPLILFVDAKGNLPAAIKKSLPAKAVVEIKTKPAERKQRIRTLAQQRARDADVSFDGAALAFLCEQCGDDLAVAEREIDKVILWAEAGATITLEACRNLIDEAPEEQIWPLMDAISAKQPDKALHELQALVEQGNHPIYINTMILRQVRILLHTSLVRKTARTEKEALGAIKGPEWKKKDILAQSKAFPIPALKHATTALYQADLDLKGGKPREFETQIVERLILDLCNTA